jgi:hypothetical protein
MPGPTKGSGIGGKFSEADKAHIQKCLTEEIVF